MPVGPKQYIQKTGHSQLRLARRAMLPPQTVSSALSEGVKTLRTLCALVEATRDNQHRITAEGCLEEYRRFRSASSRPKNNEAPEGTGGLARSIKNAGGVGSSRGGEAAPQATTAAPTECRGSAGDTEG